MLGLRVRREEVVHRPSEASQSGMGFKEIDAKALGHYSV